MESRKQILDFISKEGHERRQYLTDLLKYMPEAIAKELAFVEVKKNENIIVAGSSVFNGDVEENVKCFLDKLNA